MIGRAEEIVIGRAQATGPELSQPANQSESGPGQNAKNSH